MKISVNNAELFVDVEGSCLKVTKTKMDDKPVMAILHGGPGMDHSYYRPWLTPLSRSAQLLYIDHRGTGRSSKVPLETCTTEQMADDVEEVRRKLGIDKWVVLGNSFGGMWALTYAVRHQDSLSHLILVDTTSSWKDCWKEVQKMAEKMGTPEQKEIYRDAFVGKVQSEEELKHWFDVMYPIYFHKYKPLYGKMMERGKSAPEVAAYMWKNVMYDYDVRKHLKGLRIPTLITVGRFDWVTPVNQSEYLAENIPNSKLVIFEKSGHSPFVEEQKAFNKLVADFMKSHT